jgi:hypothetical protein
METFSDFEPSVLNRIQWYKQSNRVLCDNCWWVGLDDEHDHCPDCNSDHLGWIFDTKDDYDCCVADNEADCSKLTFLFSIEITILIFS